MALFGKRSSTPEPAPVGAPAASAPVVVDAAAAVRLEQAERIRRGGRPRTDQPRSRSLNVRFTEAEWARVVERAEEAGRSPRELAREALLRGRMVASAPVQAARADAELSGQLARIGSNLNQLVRAVNQAATAGALDADQVRDAVHQVEAMRQSMSELAR